MRNVENFTLQKHLRGKGFALIIVWLIKTIEGNYVNSDGFNKIHWDGRDEDGDEIANGVYPYKLIIKNGSKSKEKIEKLVVLK